MLKSTIKIYICSPYSLNEYSINFKNQIKTRNVLTVYSLCNILLSSEAVRVDTSALKKKHTQLQRELHPDKFSIKSQVSVADGEMVVVSEKSLDRS